jgi:hypothetical protein
LEQQLYGGELAKDANNKIRALWGLFIPIDGGFNNNHCFVVPGYGNFRRRKKREVSKLKYKLKNVSVIKKNILYDNPESRLFTQDNKIKKYNLNKKSEAALHHHYMEKYFHC